MEKKYQSSGCDSEFEGELLWYTPALEIIIKLLDAAAESFIGMCTLFVFERPDTVLSSLLGI